MQGKGKILRRIGSGVLTALMLTAPVVGCGGGKAKPVGPPGLVDDAAITDFYARANTFYQQLSHRRINSSITFNDDGLREVFKDDRQFSDYYAQLAQSLVVANFERNRPISVEVKGFSIDGPGKARVRIKFVGDHGLPLRWWRVSHSREDQWERSGGEWWIIPGKL